MVTAAVNKQQIIDRISNLRSALTTLGVRRLALFGSFSRNSQHSDSDVDLLVEFAPGRKNYDNFVAICDLLEDSLQRRVEVITTESLSPHIGPHILQEAEDVLVAQ